MTLYHGLNLKIMLGKIHYVLFSYSKRPFYIILLNYAAQKWSTKIEHMIKGWNDVVKPCGKPRGSHDVYLRALR